MNQQDHIKEHGEFRAKIEGLEGDVEKLWRKWDRMIWLVISTLIGVIVNLGVLIYKG